MHAAKPQATGRPAVARTPDPAFVSQVDAALVELGRMADRTSTVIAFRSELSSLAALERALRAADCPWFGVDLDPAAVLADAWDLDEVFSRLGALIRHVRGRDAVGGTGARTKPTAIGRGDTDWAHLLSNLSGADYAGWITVDPGELPDRQAAAAEAVRYLKSLR
jgi:sugar phosphate isomerase/epimerase